MTELTAHGVELPPTELTAHGVEQPLTELPSTEVPFTEAKRRAEASFERDYLSRLMAISGGSVTGAARLAGVDRTNFRRLLQRSGVRPRGATAAAEATMITTTGPAHATKYTDRILTILDENGQGLRTCEIAVKIEQALNFAFGILKSLERQGRVVRHGSRYNTLWTLPGAQPVPRIETIPAAVVAVLSGETRPMDGRRLHDEIRRLLRGVGKPPSEASLRRGISRLITAGMLAYQGANEHGAMYVKLQVISSPSSPRGRRTMEWFRDRGRSPSCRTPPGPPWRPCCDCNGLLLGLGFTRRAMVAGLRVLTYPWRKRPARTAKSTQRLTNK
jgi:hypothetical protein